MILDNEELRSLLDVDKVVMRENCIELQKGNITIEIQARTEVIGSYDQEYSTVIEAKGYITEKRPLAQKDLNILNKLK